MHIFHEEEIISQKLIPGITPDFIISQLEPSPILYEQWKLNSEYNQRRLIEVMMRAPSNSDRPGYIYGFRTKQGYNSKDEQYLIKMGRTKLQIPQQRIFQWQKEDCHQYVEIFTIRSEFNVKLQALVHLLFAYARKIIYINGKKRIQWFQFYKKTPTGAAINLLNLLMQRVHERNFQQIVKPVNLNDFEQFLKKVLLSCTFNRQKQRIILFGLPQTGKTTFGHIFLEVPMIAKKVDNKFRILFEKNEKVDQNILEITSVSEELENNKESNCLQKYFIQWHNICNTETILPFLIVKQSDIESSMMIGLFEGLKLVNQYLKLQRSPVIVVNRASQSFTEKMVQTIYEESKSYLSKRKLKQLQDIHLTIVKQAHVEGKFLPIDESKHISENINEWKKKGQWGSIQFKLSQQLLRQCRLIIQMSYSFLQERYGTKFLLKIKQIKDQHDQIEYLHYIKNQLAYLKGENHPSQQRVHQSIRNLNDFLAFQQKEDISSFLYSFCQCVANKSLSHTLIFDDLQTNINAKSSELISIQNQKLRKHLDNFKLAIQKYIKMGNFSFLKDFKAILNEDKYQKIMEILQSIIEVNLAIQFGKNVVIDVDEEIQQVFQSKQKQQTKKLIQSIEKLVQLLKNLQIYSKTGLRFDSVVGRIRQAIHVTLKSQQKEIKKISSFTVVKQVKQLPKKSIPKEKEKQILPPSDYSKSHLIQINLMSSLKTELQKIAEGLTIINVVKEVFIIDIKKLHLKHNLIILTKSIKVYEQFEISLENRENKDKLHMIVIAQNLTNYEKMKMTTSSRIGKLALLALIDNSMTPLDPYHSKYPKKIQTDFYRGLLAIYMQKVK